MVQKCIFCKKEFDLTENKVRNICPNCAICVICGNEIDQLDKEGRSICINCGKKYFSDSLIIHGPFPVKNRKFQLKCFNCGVKLSNYSEYWRAKKNKIPICPDCIKWLK